MIKNDLLNYIESLEPEDKFNLLPNRIFLDTNVLQYMQDFGEYIFDNYREYEDRFEIIKNGEIKTIKIEERLFQEIEALHDIFINHVRIQIEFVISESIFKEVIKKKDKYFTQWFYDMWYTWQDRLSEYRNVNPFSIESKERYKKALKDTSLSGSFSKQDLLIILDSIMNDCDALLTVDKYAKDQNKKLYTFKNYHLMILTPIELLTIIEPYQPLWV